MFENLLVSPLSTCVQGMHSEATPLVRVLQRSRHGARSAVLN